MKFITSGRSGCLSNLRQRTSKSDKLWASNNTKGHHVFGQRITWHKSRHQQGCSGAWWNLTHRHVSPPRKRTGPPPSSYWQLLRKQRLQSLPRSKHQCERSCPANRHRFGSSCSPPCTSSDPRPAGPSETPFPRGDRSHIAPVPGTGPAGTATQWRGGPHLLLPARALLSARLLRVLYAPTADKQPLPFGNPSLLAGSHAGGGGTGEAAPQYQHKCPGALPLPGSPRAALIGDNTKVAEARCRQQPLTSPPNVPAAAMITATPLSRQPAATLRTRNLQAQGTRACAARTQKLTPTRPCVRGGSGVRMCSSGVGGMRVLIVSIIKFKE